ncbi:MAG: helix-turn-helix domain-containing protein [Patescibacteria group bacterium]|nr:helix-turn-helix domain-containing protein [Patescibacteria group bacterium]
MKYWNKARIRRAREQERRREERLYRDAEAEMLRRRTYGKGEPRKNARLMLDALGVERNRRMLARLHRAGAMSVSKLAAPFNITLPSAMAHVETLERAGLITTRKHGRIRLCIYNTRAPKELSEWLATRDPFCLDD